MVTMFADAETIMLRMCSRLDEAKGNLRKCRRRRLKTTVGANIGSEADAQPPAAAMSTQSVRRQMPVKSQKDRERFAIHDCGAGANKVLSSP